MPSTSLTLWIHCILLHNLVENLKTGFFWKSFLKIFYEISFIQHIQLRKISFGHRHSKRSPRVPWLCCSWHWSASPYFEILSLGPHSTLYKHSLLYTSVTDFYPLSCYALFLLLPYMYFCALNSVHTLNPFISSLVFLVPHLSFSPVFLDISISYLKLWTSSKQVYISLHISSLWLWLSGYH